ncbi:MAG: hypothetical protein K0R78_2954 [Pelosinus sp.]|jgi:hypothetical protein|nr:hypothetical protein [Pelosinus sp.]
MGQKKVNKANDAFSLKKAKGQSNKKSNNSFGSKNTNHPYHPST